MGHKVMKSLRLALGLYDDPEQQAQKNYSADLLRSNIAVFGTAMSGKTTLLKTLLLRLHQVHGVTDKEEIYILDFSNDLYEYKELPYVTVYFDAFQEENVRRIFKIVEERYEQNIRALPGRAFVDAEEDDTNEDSVLRHVTFILDGLNEFMSDDKYAAYHEIFRKLSRDGLSKGVSVVFTANDSSNGISRLLSSFNRVIAFDIPKEQYSELFGKKAEKPMIVKGRGIANIDTDVYEFQAYFPYNRDDWRWDDKAAVGDITEHLERYGNQPGMGRKEDNMRVLRKCYERKMKIFTGDLVKKDWQNYTGLSWEDYRNSSDCGAADFIAGLDYYTFVPIKINLEKTRSIAIYGNKSSGKTNLLSLILETAMNIPDAFFVFWEDGRHGLTRNAEAVNENIIQKLKWHEQYEMFYGWEELEGFIRGYGYDPLENAQPIPFFEDEEPEHFSVFGNMGKPKKFTVFVIQSRLFYQSIPGNESAQYISRISRFIMNEDSEAGKLFVFSDAQKITDMQMGTIFNNCVDHAFLLYDILRFIKDRGQKSVFGALEEEELKERYGKCETGDGFYLNHELEEHTKLKFIKQN